MSLVTAANLELTLDGKVLFASASLTLDTGQKVGMVGRNGCGKSTLLKLIAGLTDLQPQAGQVQTSRDITIGYLHQDPLLEAGRTLRQEAQTAFAHVASLRVKLETLAHKMAEAQGDDLARIMAAYERAERRLHAAGGFAVEHQVDTALHGVGLTDEFFDVPVGDLSGGQKGRLALAKLLLSQPDVLLMDEPTNHLDIAGRQWLEDFLLGFGGAVLVVSHDRWLLDRVVDRICELHEGRIEEYTGGYAAFLEQRAQRRLAQQRVYDKQQQRIKSEQAFIDRYRAGQRARQAQGRQKRLERYVRDELIEQPVELEQMRLTLRPGKRAGDLVITADHIAKAHPGKTLFRDLSVVLKRGDRLGVIGPNGSGKSTLVRCLLGEEEPDSGKVRLGANVEVGFYRQSHEHLDGSRSVVEYLRQFVMGGSGALGSEQAARDLAGAFLFSGVDQDKTLAVLSGGERSRAVLAGLVAGGHNLLVLDEPTNHLDIPSAERLEAALRQFTAPVEGFAQNPVGSGTLVLITHDRMLLEHLVDQLLVFDGRGHVRHFLGTYSEYLATQTAKPTPAQDSVENKPRPRSAEAKPPTVLPAKRRKSALETMAQDSLEARIIAIEEALAELDGQLANPQTYRDPARVKAAQQRRAELDAELAPLEAEWARRAE